MLEVGHRYAGTGATVVSLDHHKLTKPRQRPKPPFLICFCLKVKPAGSAWARNPIPDDSSRCSNKCREFPPPCKEIPKCEVTKYLFGQDTTCLCSGAWGPYVQP